MLYSEKIGELRAEVGDTRRRVHVDWIGDGSTTVFQMPADTFPVLDQVGTYLVKVAGVTKTEASDYTLDKRTGTLTINSAPTLNQAITIDNSAVYLIDADWLTIINQVIHSLGKDYFKEFVDETLTSTRGMVSLDISTAQPQAFAIYELTYRMDSGSNYMLVDDISNWRYDEDGNKFYFGTNTGFLGAYGLKFRGLRRYIVGDAVTDTLDVQDRYLSVIDNGAIARYWKHRYKSVVELVSKNTTENTRTPLQELMMLADRYTRDFESDRKRLQPTKPPRTIPNYNPKGGRA